MQGISHIKYLSSDVVFFFYLYIITYPTHIAFFYFLIYSYANICFCNLNFIFLLYLIA